MPNDLPDVVSSTNRGLVNDAFLYFSAAVSSLAVCAVSFVSASLLDVGFFAIACCSLLNLSHADRISTNRPIAKRAGMLPSNTILREGAATRRPWGPNNWASHKCLGAI